MCFVGRGPTRKTKSNRSTTKYLCSRMYWIGTSRNTTEIYSTKKNNILLNLIGRVPKEYVHAWDGSEPPEIQQKSVKGVIFLCILWIGTFRNTTKSIENNRFQCIQLVGPPRNTTNIDPKCDIWRKQAHQDHFFHTFRRKPALDDFGERF